ncbi:MAG: hypothetical protein QXE05_02690 [Nitrososphaeria archaeon]
MLITEWTIAGSVTSRQKRSFSREAIFSYERPSIFRENMRGISLKLNLLLPPLSTFDIGGDTCFYHLQQYLLLTTYFVTTTLASTMSLMTLV